MGLSGCHDGGGNGLTKTSLITHLRDRHCNGDVQAITRQYLSTNLAILRRLRFVLYELTKPHIPSFSEQLDHVDDLVQVQHGGFTFPLLDSLFSKGLRTVKSIPPKCCLGFSRVLKEAIDKVIYIPDDISCSVSLLVLPFCLLKSFRSRSNLKCKSAIKHQRQEEIIVNVIRAWSLPGGSLQYKRKICDGHYTAVVRDLSSSSVAPYNDATLEDLKTKHPFNPPPSLPHIYILIIITSLGEFIASGPLTPLVKPGDGIRPIDVGNVWRRLVSKVSAIMIVHSLDGYLDGLLFGVGVAGESEAILLSVNRFIEAYRDDGGLSMLLVDFKNAFNLVD
nr:putative reverse transcriptase domain-containing protein [Tanacetum cinerariifolium]